MKTILIVGAGAFTNPLAFINKGKVPGERVIVTELRTESALQTEYGNLFTNNCNQLRKQGVKLCFGTDALKLHALPQSSGIEEKESVLCQEDVKDITQIIWFSPHFGRIYEREHGHFQKPMRQFFQSVFRMCQNRDKSHLKVTVALDAISPDAIYNLFTRFGIFTIPDWQVKFVVDLRGVYTFSPSLTNDKAYNNFARFQNNVVQGLVLTYEQGCHQYSDRIPQAFFMCSDQLRRIRDKAKPGDVLCQHGQTPKLWWPYPSADLFKLPVYPFTEYCNDVLMEKKQEPSNQQSTRESYAQTFKLDHKARNQSNNSHEFHSSLALNHASVPSHTHPNKYSNAPRRAFLAATSVGQAEDKAGPATAHQTPLTRNVEHTRQTLGGLIPTPQQTSVTAQPGNKSKAKKRLVY